MSKGTSKSKNSYSLLLKGAAEMEKRGSKKSSLSKKSSSDSESTRSEEKPTTSHKVEVVYDPDVPDRSYGDFHCKICDSHMNAIEMWEAHIAGKRHLKNVEKGDADSKYEDLPNAESSINYELKNVTEPVVGLSYIHEIRRREPNIPPIYNCFLCHASLATVPIVTEHVLSLKHRLNYIKEKNYDEFVMINGTNLKKGQMEPLVVDAVVRLEREHGQGVVKVKQEKKKKSVTTYSAKKAFKLDEDAAYSVKKTFNMNGNRTCKNLRSDTDTSVWKSRNVEKRHWERSRSRSRSRDFDNSYTNRCRSRSPVNSSSHYGDFLEFECSKSSNQRPFLRKEHSPCEIAYDRPNSISKRYVSSSYDSNHANSNKYLPGELNYSNSRHHTRSLDSNEILSRPDTGSMRHTRPLDSNETLSRPDAQSINSGLSLENYCSSGNRNLLKVLKIASNLSEDDRYSLLLPTLAIITEIKTPEDIACMLHHLRVAKRKIRESRFYGFLQQFVSERYGRNLEIPGLDGAAAIPGLEGAAAIPGLEGAAAIPGLEGAAASADQLMSVTAQNSMEDFKSINSNYSSGSTVSPQEMYSRNFFPSQPSTSYLPSINSQQTGNDNTFQMPLGNFQVSSSSKHTNQTIPSQQTGSDNTFQMPLRNFQVSSSSKHSIPISSFPNQSSYQHQTQSSVSPNIQNLSQGQSYNYSYSSSSASKNYPY